MLRVWKLWIFFDVTRIAQVPILLLSYEARRDVGARACRTNHMEAQESIKCHAYPNSSRLQPVLQAICDCFSEIPFLWFRAVFGCIRPGMIGSSRRVKRHYVHTGWREHCQIQIVRYDPLVIFRQPPLQGNSLGVFAETLIGLIPMEDKRLERTHTHAPKRERIQSGTGWIEQHHLPRFPLNTAKERKTYTPSYP